MGLAAVLKAGGLSGMTALAYKRVASPWLFGACFFLDAQATASAITLGQSVALSVTAASRAGTAASIAKSAFAIGPMFWAWSYQGHFSPDVATLFLCACVAGAGLLALFASVVQISGAE